MYHLSITWACPTSFQFNILSYDCIRH
ncbi:hypothetical protein H4I95_11454 [Botrytis cinerea]